EAELKPLVVLLLLAALVAGGTAVWMWYGMTHAYQGFPKEGVFVDVPRGTSSRYVSYILKKNGVVRSKLAFEIYARRHPKRTLQGFLCSATYELPRNPAASELTTEMVRKFKEEWRRIASPTAGGPTDEGDHRLVNRIVTLASLVERETPKPEERPLVAGAFENRLRKGMRLQCDPTVIYGMERLGKYNGGLTGKDLQFDSPYNTYEHGGLPPGPIGNPGEASLRAAIHPAQTNYLYFVANTQGGHFFGATLAEHNRNVLKYRRLLAGLPADPPPPPAPPPSPRKKHSKLHRGKAR